MLWMIVRSVFWIAFWLLPGAFILGGGWFTWKRLGGRTPHKN
jgi:hypothetical protein